MLMEIIILIVLIPLIIVLSFFYIFPWIFGAPFEATRRKKLKKIIDLANVKPGDKVAELGSGDGRIVIALAKKGAEVHGFEINPLLVLLSRWKIKKLKLEKRAFIHLKNFWKVNFNSYNVVIFFQFVSIMKKLKDKLMKELKPGSKIVSYYWKFPLWDPVKNYENIYLYKIKKK